MQAVLEDMIKARDVMQAQLERSEPEPSAVAAM